MSYYVRLLTHSEKVVPVSEMILEVDSLKLIRGTDQLWEQINVLDEAGNLMAILERQPVSESDTARKLTELKDAIRRSYPESAREWLLKYLADGKTIYAFQLFTDNIDARADWQVLGRVQNCLKDKLGGIIQADDEGYYNENGDYILWQMYSGAGGTIPAAVLDENGEWVPFQLKLDDPQAVDNFKAGIVPRRGFLSTLFGK